MQRYNTSAVIMWWLFSYWETPSPRRILPAHVSFFHKGIYLNCFLQKTREHKHKHKGKRIWRSFIVLNFHESIKQSYYFLECFSVTFFPRKVFSFLVTPFFCKQLNFWVQYHFWVQNFWKDSSTVSSDYMFKQIRIFETTLCFDLIWAFVHSKRLFKSDITENKLFLTPSPLLSLFVTNISKIFQTTSSPCHQPKSEAVFIARKVSTKVYSGFNGVYIYSTIPRTRFPFLNS